MRASTGQGDNRGDPIGAPLTRIAVLTNPRARQNRRNPALVERLRAVLGDRGEVHAPADHTALAALAERLRDEGVEVVGIHGGDGTAHTVLTALARAYGDRPLPAVALLPGGTMNTVASGVGVRGAGPRVLARVVRALESGTPPTVERTLMRVRTGTGPDQYGFLFGNGLIANYLEAYYEGSEPTPLKALWVLTRGIFSALVNGAFFRRLMRPVEVEVEHDEGSWPMRPVQAIGAGTADDVGFGFRPFFLAPSHPGHIHALGIACPPLSVVFQLPNIRLARACSHPDIHSVLTRRLRIRGRERVTFMVDGDFHTGTEEVVVEAGPVVRLVVAGR